MGIFNKKDIIKIEEDDLKDAKLSSIDFSNDEIKKRAFIDVLGARLAMKLLFGKKIQANNVYSLYTIHSILEEIDIADIYYDGIKIDVRLVFNRDEIFIPKSHFEYDLIPDLYLVLELKEDMSSVEFLGFFEPKMLDKTKFNKDFYFIEYEKLILPKALKTFFKGFVPKNDYRVIEENIIKSENLLVSLLDKEISPEDKSFLFKQLSGSISLREKIVELENFDILSAEAIKNNVLIKDSVLDIVGTQKLYENEEETLEETLLEEVEYEEETAIEEEEAEIGEDEKMSRNLEDLAEASYAATPLKILSSEEEISIAEEEETIPPEKEESLEDLVVEIEQEELKDNKKTEKEEKSAGAFAAGLAAGAVAGGALAAAGAAAAAEADIVDESIKIIKTGTELAGTVIEEIANLKDKKVNKQENDFIENEKISEVKIEGTQKEEVLEELTKAKFEEAEEIEFAELQQEEMPEEITETKFIEEIAKEIEFAELQQEEMPEKIAEEIEEETVQPFDLSTTQIEEEPSLEDLIKEAENLQIEETEEEAEEALQEDIFEKIASKEQTEEPPVETILEEKELKELAIKEETSESAKEKTIEKTEEKVFETSLPFLQELPELNSLENFNTETKEKNPQEQNEQTVQSENELLLKEKMKNFFKPEEENVKETELITEAEPETILEVSTEKSLVENKKPFETLIDKNDEEIVQKLREIENYEIVDETIPEYLKENLTDDSDKLISQVDDLLKEMESKQSLEKSSEKNLSFDDLKASENVDNLILTNVAPSELPEETEEFDTFSIRKPKNYDDVEIPAGLVKDIQEAKEIEKAEEINKITETEEAPDIQPKKEDKDVLKVLFKEEKTETTEKTDTAVKSPDLVKLEELKQIIDKGKENILPKLQPFLKEKKMVIAASLSGIVLISTIIAINAPNKNNLSQTLQSPITKEEQVPNNLSQENMQNMNSQTQSSDTNLDTLTQAPYENQQAGTNRDMGQAVSDAFLSEPINANISKVAWEVPEDLAYNDSFRKYLQIAGKNLKLNIQNDLLAANEMAYSNKVIVDMVINKDGSLQTSNIVVSSGSKQIDKIVLQSVKDTLKYLKMPSSEINSNSVNATLIINF